MPELLSMILLATAAAVLVGLIWLWIGSRSGSGQEYDAQGLRVLSLLAARDEYAEALVSYRHYSGLRFVMLTLFTGITSFMAGALLNNDAPEAGAKLLTKLPTIGAWLTLAFFHLELVLDTIQSSISLFLKRSNPGTHMQRGTFLGLLQASVRIPIFILYTLVFWFWTNAPGASDLITLMSGR